MISNHKEQDVVKKTRFGEIIKGLEKGGAYAFDRESYDKFFILAVRHGLSDLPEPKSFFLEIPAAGLHIIRIQFGGVG